MSLGGGVSLRTIWITLRAINYTQQAFAQIARDVGNLQKSEKALIEQTTQMRGAALKFISAGMMFTVLGVMMTNTMFSLAGSTAQGAAAIGFLGANFEAAKQAIGGAIFEIMKAVKVFDILNGVLNLIRSNQIVAYIVGGFLMIISVLAIVAGVILMLKGAFLALDTALIIHQKWAWLTYAVNTQLGMSFKELGISVGLAFGAFTILYMIGQKFGPWAALIIGVIMAICAALIKLYILESMTTFGFVAIMGGIAAGTAVGVLAGAGVLQEGTRSAPRTGMALVHKGEIVYNPSSRRPTQIANDIEGANQGLGGGRTTNIPIVIENVHTKADMDDLDEQLRKGLKKSMRESR